MKIEIELPDGALSVTAALPELLSQRTTEAVLGVPKRVFLDSLPRFRVSGADVFKLGRLRLVRRADYVAWLAGIDKRREV